MIQFTNNEFVVPAVLTVPVRDDYFSQHNIEHFDNDGFQLNRIEQLYYTANGIHTEECLSVNAAHYIWATVNHPNYILDHSMVLTRCCYAGQALEQLKEHSQQFPYLRKYLTMKPKWGFDFALEYFDDDVYMELLHFERDFNNLDNAKREKSKIEQKLQSTDWAAFTLYIKRTRAEWSTFSGMNQNNWKAQKWGETQAEITLKAF